MYVSMHVCMYACMHVCMYACMHVCMYAYMHVCMYACMHVCMYACMHVYVRMCVSLCVYRHTGENKHGVCLLSCDSGGALLMFLLRTILTTLGRNRCGVAARAFL